MATAGPVPQKNEVRVFYEPAIDRSAPSDAVKKRLQKEAKDLYEYEDDAKYDARATSEDDVRKQVQAFESKSSKQKEAFWGKSTTPGSFTLLRKSGAKKMEEGYMDGYRYLLEEDKKEYEELKDTLESSLADPNTTAEAKQKFTEILTSVNERLSLTAERLAVLTKAENKEDLNVDEASTLVKTLEETGAEVAKTHIVSSSTTQGINAVPTPRETGAMKLKKVGGEVFSSQEKIKQAQKEAHEAKEVAELLQDVLRLTFEVETDLAQAKSMQDNIEDDTIRSAFRSKTTKIETLFLGLRKSPTKSLLAEFLAELEELKKSIDRTNDYIRNNPKSAPAIASPIVPPAPTDPPTPLREYGGWPTSFEVFYRKQSKNMADGWFFRGDLTTMLSEEEASEWDAEKKSFNEVYKKYIAFIRNLKTSDKHMARSLFEAKNAVVDAVREKDLPLVSLRREEFEKSLEHWEERWKDLQELQGFAKKFEGVTKVAIEVLANMENQTEAKNLRAKQNEIDDAIAKAKEGILKGDKIDFEALTALVDRYKKIIDTYKSTRDALSPQTKMGRAVLRPIISTDKNKNQEIRVSGGGHSNIPENDHTGLTVEEYAAILKNREEAESKVTLTPEMLAEWPELHVAGHLEGEDIDKTTLERLQTKIKFERMLRRSEDSFLSLYAVPAVDPNTQEVGYTATENFRKHPHKEIIREVLKEKRGIVIFDQTRGPRATRETMVKEQEMLRRTAHGQTYNPTRDLEKGLLFKTLDKKTKVSSTGGMVTNTKRRPITMAEDLGNEHREPTLGKTLSLEDQEKRESALKKIHDITQAMEHWFTKEQQRRGLRARPMWSVLGAAALGAVLAVGTGSKNAVEQVEPNTAAVAPVEEGERLFDWKEGFADKQFIDDAKKMTIDQIIIKYAPLAADQNKPSTIRDVLAMDGNKVLYDPGQAYGLDDDKRSQLCALLRKIEELSRAVGVAVRDKLARAGVDAAEPDWQFTPNVSIQQGLEKMRAKIAQVDK